MDSGEIISSVIVGLAGVLVTVIYARHARRLAEDQMQHELFIRFNERYDRLNDALREIQEQYPTWDALEKAPNFKALRNAIIDFFNLCAEEYYWYRHKKRIDEYMWRSWHGGMNHWYNEVEAIRTLWQAELQKSRGRDSYYLKEGETLFQDNGQRVPNHT